MNEGDIVLLNLPQTDGQYKLRPALILKSLSRFNDFLVCGISSKLNQKIEGVDEVLSQKNNYFLDTGLRQDSLIRLLFIGVKPTHEILGILGNIPEHLHKEMLNRLANFLVT